MTSDKETPQTPEHRTIGPAQAALNLDRTSLSFLAEDAEGVQDVVGRIVGSKNVPVAAFQSSI